VVAQLEAASRLTEFDHVFPVSAKKGAGLVELMAVLAEGMPEGPPHFPPEEATDTPLGLRLADLVREKALGLTREELPHSIAVEVEEIERDEELVRVTAVLLVERESQKGIVIGRGGAVLKRVGTEARKEMEALLGSKVYLDLRVKVQKEWQRDPKALGRLGY
jgi:GTP-binding protein Era